MIHGHVILIGENQYQRTASSNTTSTACNESSLSKYSLITTKKNLIINGGVASTSSTMTNEGVST